MKSSNAIWVQHENADNNEYLFFEDELIASKDIGKVKYIRELFFNNPSKEIIWESKDYSQSSVSTLKDGFIITGVLINKDKDNRKLPFMIFLKNGNIDNGMKYINENLSKIHKKVDENLLLTFFTEISSYKKSKKSKKIIVIGVATVLTIIIYKLVSK
ncbi:hypothetical protein [Chondrinema litorale]|uniref:hypothetical protein n=1 Tax=Chondrinema litorale TaxID=2994555 RepID=UPI0025430CE2|nr:hypothetical protein [Chondrinema litorale]UZR99851.1 hypothetical protein OQ292_38340 [Chondrinema litorale]